MASYTPNLNLYKKDPIADGNDFFNIKTMMNDNWDKIDEKVKAALDDIGDLQSEQVRIATGSYEGTGTYGASNPCSLTFDFVPKAGFIYGADFNNFNLTNSGGINLVPFSGAETTIYYHSSFGVTLKISGDTVTWYFEYSDEDYTKYGPGGQLNMNGQTYHWIAIG